jgi:hypothetical protein
LNTKQAKDFLVEQTLVQAGLEGVPIDDVEKRMMYFTESDATSCDDPIELNGEFEAEHETKEYESKVSRLLHHAYMRLKKENPEGTRTWEQAIRTLRKGDHYLLVANSLGDWDKYSDLCPYSCRDCPGPEGVNSCLGVRLDFQ